VVNVRDFGAVPDAPISQHPAFARALSAVKDAGGGKLIVPKGNYLLGKNVDGYHTGLFDPFHNSSLQVDFGNLTIEGEGPGITVLKADSATTTLLYLAGAGIRNVTLRGLTLEQPDDTFLWDNCATTFLRKGLDPKKATEFIDQGWTLGTMAYFLGTPESYLEGLTIEDCELINPTRHGIGFGYVNGADFLHNSIRYYDGHMPAEHTQTATGAGRCGFLSGSEPVHDVRMEHNRFNGNVNGNRPRANPDGTYSFMGADGFSWTAKGGAVTVSHNHIRNFSLEAMHHESAPFMAEGNQLVTTCATPSTLACLAYPCTIRPEWIDAPIFKFDNNIVRGCTIGLNCKGPFFAFSPTDPVPRSRISANGNDFQGVDYPFAAIGADLFQASNNTVDFCKQFFITSVDDLYPKTLDFRCKNLIFSNNSIEKCSSITFMIQTGLQNGGLLSITGGSAPRGLFHLLLGDPPKGGSYNVKIGSDVVWREEDGRPAATPFVYTPFAPSIEWF
jgi:Pectate lyase superfamily protein